MIDSCDNFRKLRCILDFERSRNQRQSSDVFLGKWILEGGCPLPSSSMVFLLRNMHDSNLCVKNPYAWPLKHFAMAQLAFSAHKEKLSPLPDKIIAGHLPRKAPSQEMTLRRGVGRCHLQFTTELSRDVIQNNEREWH